MSYPEHEKLRTIADQSQAIHDFLERTGYTLCEWVEIAPEDVDECGESSYVPVVTSLDKLLAKFFGIDLDVIEREKRQMLDAQRELNDARAAR